MPKIILLYCTTHDDGIIVNSDDNNSTICCEGSTAKICNFEYDGDNIEINKIQRDYNKYGGGFRFEYYNNVVRRISKL